MEDLPSLSAHDTRCGALPGLRPANKRVRTLHDDLVWPPECLIAVLILGKHLLLVHEMMANIFKPMAEDDLLLGKLGLAFEFAASLDESAPLASLELLEIEIANENAVSLEVFTLGGPQESETALELVAASRLVWRLRFEVTCGDDETLRQASFRYNQRTVHVAFQRVFVVFARELRDDHGSIGPHFSRTHGATLAHNARDVGILKEVLLRRRCHLLQADKVSVAFLDDLEDSVEPFWTYFVKPNVVGQNLDRLTPLTTCFSDDHWCALSVQVLQPRVLQLLIDVCEQRSEIRQLAEALLIPRLHRLLARPIRLVVLSQTLD